MTPPGDDRQPDPETPYATLPPESFWRTGVAEAGFFGQHALHNPRFAVRRSDRIVTFGSCFAQHIGAVLRDWGFNWFEAEAPPPMLSAESAARFGYGVFSARTGTIFTPAHLRHWIEGSLDDIDPGEEVWTGPNGYVDPLRPTVPPGAYPDRSELFATRRHTLDCVARAFDGADIAILTLGQTEVWRNRQTGAVYPMCPGTRGGTFDPACHALSVQTCAEVTEDMIAVIDRLHARNPALRLILTVSPVPLTATAQPGKSALVANTQSKAVLRAAVAELVDRYTFVDYLPSYELLGQPFFGGIFLSPNKRTVERAGVQAVMAYFRHWYCSEEDRAAPDDGPVAAPAGDIDCDEFILDYYNNG